MIESEPRHTFDCRSCASSFSIAVERIPPVRTRFSCPKCGKSMEFPSRDEVRNALLSPGEASAEPSPPPPPAEPMPPIRPVQPPAVEPPSPPPAPPPAAPPPPELDATPAETPAAAPAPDAEKRYTVQRVGFEGDSFDRRQIRILIRTAAVNENDTISFGDAAPVRADQLPELKSLFELRKTSRFTPPPVCRKHLDRVAHYVCAATDRPLCEECAAERKYGGTSVRVCDHCNGNVRELHNAPGDVS